MQVKTTPFHLMACYDATRSAVVADNRCVKCWALEFGQAVFGRNTEVYSIPVAGGIGGVWLFDVDKANELAAGRIDVDVPPREAKRAAGKREGSHAYCLLKRYEAGVGILPIDTPRAGGILADVPGFGYVLIDGTHRAHLTAAAGCPFPCSVLTPTEFALVKVSGPGDDIQEMSNRELIKMTTMFEGMNADEFFSRCAAVLGASRMRQFVGRES